jgi:hypothetical protein
MSRASWCVFFISVFLALVFGSCFSADSEPPDGEGPPASSTDDDNGDDETDDDADDDGAFDDDSDDDADDDFDDDTGAVNVDCGQIIDFVYENCGDSVALKPDGDRLPQGQSLVDCEEGGGFWECLQVCLNVILENPDNQCSSLIDCADSDCQIGSLELVDVP